MSRFVSRLGQCEVKHTGNKRQEKKEGKSSQCGGKRCPLSSVSGDATSVKNQAINQSSSISVAYGTTTNDISILKSVLAWTVIVR